MGGLSVLVGSVLMAGAAAAFGLGCPFVALSHHLFIRLGVHIVGLAPVRLVATRRRWGVGPIAC